MVIDVLCYYDLLSFWMIFKLTGIRLEIRIWLWLIATVCHAAMVTQIKNHTHPTKVTYRSAICTSCSWRTVIMCWCLNVSLSQQILWLQHSWFKFGSQVGIFTVQRSLHLIVFRKQARVFSFSVVFFFFCNRKQGGQRVSDSVVKLCFVSTVCCHLVHQLKSQARSCRYSA